MKVAVIAGTNVDTRMGVEVLAKEGIKDTIFLPISETCEEQDKIQYFSKEELYRIFYEKCTVAVKEMVDGIFLYCNSLSGRVDYQKAEKELKIRIITPLETYKNLPEKIKNIAIIAANGLSAYNIEKIIKKERPDINSLAIGYLPLVDLIEKNLSPADIMKKLNIPILLNYIENIENEHYKIDTLILGCTHFPYIKEEIKKITNLNIIDPTQDMIERLKK